MQALTRNFTSFSLAPTTDTPECKQNPSDVKAKTPVSSPHHSECALEPKLTTASSHFDKFETVDFTENHRAMQELLGLACFNFDKIPEDLRKKLYSVKESITSLLLNRRYLSKDERLDPCMSAELLNSLAEPFSDVTHIQIARFTHLSSSFKGLVRFTQLIQLCLFEAKGITTEDFENLPLCAPHLRLLELLHVPLTDVHLEGLSHSRKLRELSLYECPEITTSGLAKFIDNCSSLRVLRALKCAKVDPMLSEWAKTKNVLVITHRPVPLLPLPLAASKDGLKDTPLFETFTPPLPITFVKKSKPVISESVEAQSYTLQDKNLTEQICAELCFNREAKNLQHLRIENCALFESGCVALCWFDKLKRIYITNCTNVDYQTLAAIAQNCKQLATIELNSLYLTAKDIHVLLLPKNLKTIKISNGKNSGLKEETRIFTWDQQYKIVFV
jgi:hypothetical protein